MEVTEMGGEESKPVFPQCAVINFRPSPDLNETTLANLDNTIVLLRTVSSLIPLLQMVPGVSVPASLLAAKVAGDKLILFVANVRALEKIFMDIKIANAKIESAMSLLNAEVQAVQNRRNRMLNPDLSADDKKLEVVPALHSCEKLLELFKDTSYPFWAAPLPSSEYLLAFSALYMESLYLALNFIPSYRSDAKSAAIKIRETLLFYKTKCLQERLNQTYCHVNPGGPRPTQDSELQELVAKMKDHSPISNNPNYRTDFGDNWPSVQNNQVLVSWKIHVVGFRCRETGLIAGMEAFLDYRGATRSLYGSKFDDCINVVNQLANL